MAMEMAMSMGTPDIRNRFALRAIAIKEVLGDFVCAFAFWRCFWLGCVVSSELVSLKVDQSYLASLRDCRLVLQVERGDYYLGDRIPGCLACFRVLFFGLQLVHYY